MINDEFQNIQAQFINLGASQGNKSEINLTDAKFCYMTKEQAEEWIRIGTFHNVHTLSPEMELISQHCATLDLLSEPKINLVDLGCGDGRKIPTIMNMLSPRCNIDSFLAIDACKYLLDAALSYIMKNTDLSPNSCKAYMADFEDLKAANIISHISDSARLYTFLGNTFNNFPRKKITNVLNRILRKKDALFIGVKTRRNSSTEEQNRLIQEYSSYGPRFTYSFGHILGLTDDQMQREVAYNPQQDTIEIWIRILQPSKPMIDGGLSNCQRILAGYRYVPTIDELSSWFQTFFEIKALSDSSGTNVVYLCKKY
jgi:histidine-specific SAM-dependent methyltransferase